MEINQLALKLKLTAESKELLRAEWGYSQKSQPVEKLTFLSPEFIANVCQSISLPAETVKSAIDVGQRVNADTALRSLAWHYHHCLFHCPIYPLDNVPRWPPLSRILGDDAGMFYTLVLFSGFPKMQSVYSEHSISANVASDTLSQVKYVMTEYFKKHGCWGLTTHNVEWLQNHFSGKLFHLVRLQFQFGSFPNRLLVFRHKTSGIVIALSSDNIRYLADGQLAGKGRIYNISGAWTSKLIYTNDGISGNPILPTGSALQKKIHLPKAEWQQVLGPGNPVLYIHIPDGGPMTYDLCGQSFRTALEFFPRHFPDKTFVCFYCGSWILDSQIEELLPPTSNLVRFQQEVYLVPLSSDDLHLLKVIFGRVPEDLTKASRDTALQRALLDRLLTGGHLRAGAGGCFLFPEDINWGAQVYRRQVGFWEKLLK